MDFLQNSSTPILKKHLVHFTANNFAKLLIYGYQATISYFVGGNCRYYPSCSHYAVESFSKHNFFYACYLTLKRLLSCHPFSKKEFYDPVPLKITETSNL